MMNKLSFVVLMIMSAVACMAPQDPTAREVSERNAQDVLKCLEPVVSSGKAIRLYYRASCRATKDFVADAPVPFPFTKVRPPSKGKTGLTAVREIFKNDKNVRVAEDSSGIIRIWIGKVPTAILRTKLSQLTLDPTGQYNPDNAMDAIIETKEMDAAMRLLGVNAPARFGGLLAEPDKDLPHLPSSMSAVTVEQALDMIAKTWAGQGLVMYGACGDTTGLPGGGKPFWVEYVGGIAPK